MTFDDDLATALTTLARSTPPLDGRRRVLARMAQKRRRRRALLATAVVAVLAAAGLAGLQRTQRDPQPVVPPDAVTRAVKIYSGDGGLSLSVVVPFPERTRLVRADWRLQSHSRRAVLAPRDGRDLDGPELYGPLTVAAGVRVEVGGGGTPDCGAPAGVPVLTVVSRVSGAAERRDHYVPANLAAYRSAFAKVCRAGLQAAVIGSRQDPDGRFSVTLRLINPGPGTVTVTSEAYDDRGTHWDAASVDVAVAGSAELRLSGSGEGCTHSSPWNTGHLTVDGKPLRLRAGNNEQC